MIKRKQYDVTFIDPVIGREPPNAFNSGAFDQERVMYFMLTFELRSSTGLLRPAYRSDRRPSTANDYGNSEFDDESSVDWLFCIPEMENKSCGKGNVKVGSQPIGEVTMYQSGARCHNLVF